VQLATAPEALKAKTAGYEGISAGISLAEIFSAGGPSPRDDSESSLYQVRSFFK
jgi:hypothetical protein